MIRDIFSLHLNRQTYVFNYITVTNVSQTNIDISPKYAKIDVDFLSFNGTGNAAAFIEDVRNSIPMLASERREKYVEAGISNVLCTEISKDGTLQGPATELYTKVMAQYPTLHLIASGGVSCNEDIKQLDKNGIPAVVFGKAFYEGRINLPALVDKLSR